MANERRNHFKRNGDANFGKTQEHIEQRDPKRRQKFRLGFKGLLWNHGGPQKKFREESLPYPPYFPNPPNSPNPPVDDN